MKQARNFETLTQIEEDMRAGGKRALARALASIETMRGSQELAALLDCAVANARAHVIGLTGPPGVGKSTLTNALIQSWRAAGETVGVIAVDPSSRLTGGALLGDRARLAVNPGDRGVFVRSMAARDRLGGLSEDSIAAIALMRALFDRVAVESVGVGQSEGDVSFAVDSLILCIQPGSGDSLQFMKAGVMELPDIVVVAKADMGAPALRARADVQGALSLFARQDGDENDWRAPVTLVSATTGAGLDDLQAALESHRAYLGAERLAARRAAQARIWTHETVKARFGSEGADIAGRIALDPAAGPFSRARNLCALLSEALRAAGGGRGA